jgi:hypothetical protein
MRCNTGGTKRQVILLFKDVPISTSNLEKFKKKEIDSIQGLGNNRKAMSPESPATTLCRHEVLI